MLASGYDYHISSTPTARSFIQFSVYLHACKYCLNQKKFKDAVSTFHYISRDNMREKSSAKAQQMLYDESVLLHLIV